MALLFDAASSQYLECTAPALTDYPFSAGMWVRLSAVGSSIRTWCALSDTGTSNNYIDWRMNASEASEVSAAAGGAEANGAGTAISAGEWTYVVVRALEATNRRRAALLNTGISVGNNTTSRAPTGLDTFTIGAIKTSGGASQFWDGAIAEFWLARDDCYGGAATNMTREALVALAYRGPFAFPILRERIVEYRSFRQGVVSPGDRARMKLDAVNGPLQMVDHPPLAPGYRRANAGAAIPVPI